jgi:hypothetical protein
MSIDRTTWEFVKAFRDDRLAKIDSGEIPVSLTAGSSTVLHLMPASAFSPGTQLDLSGALRQQSLTGLTGESWGLSYDFEGLLVWESGDSEETTSYAQLFRSGTVELVDTALLSSGESGEKPDMTDFERAVHEAARNWISILRALGATGPLAAALTLSGVRNWSLGPDRSSGKLTPRPIDRDDLVIPEAFLEDIAADPGPLMKALFDPIWNAGGHAGSPSFTAEGAWRGR